MSCEDTKIIEEPGQQADTLTRRAQLQATKRLSPAQRAAQRTFMCGSRRMRSLEGSVSRRLSSCRVEGYKSRPMSCA